MAEPATPELREIENMLVKASDQGELLTEAAVQAELGMELPEVHEALMVLNEHGKAEQVAPGEWGRPDPAEARREAQQARVRVALGEGEPEPEREPPGMQPFLNERDREYANPTVRLTMAIASSMSAEALGGLVKAGIDDAATREGETFVLEVLP